MHDDTVGGGGATLQLASEAERYKVLIIKEESQETNIYTFHDASKAADYLV